MPRKPTRRPAKRKDVSAPESMKPPQEWSGPTLKRVIKPRTKNHAAYLKSMADNTITFALGPAGGGKTYMAVGYASSLLAAGAIKKIVLCRPMVQAGDTDEIGFLPGDVGLKAGPFMAPLTDALLDFFGAQDIDRLVESGALQVLPISLMRGKSLRSSFVIVDEAQNCTAKQVRLVLTRIEAGCKVVLAGDQGQSDISHIHPIDEIADWLTGTSCGQPIAGIGRVKFGYDDNQRDPLITEIDKRMSAKI